jgi:hypothetical protein
MGARSASGVCCGQAAPDFQRPHAEGVGRFPRILPCRRRRQPKNVIRKLALHKLARIPVCPVLWSRASPASILPVLPFDSRTFIVADLTASGDLHARTPYSYTRLEQIPGTVELIAHASAHLWRSPEEFEAEMPPPHRHILLRWRASSTTSGIATLRVSSTLASLSLLASGLDADADRLTLEAFQRHLLRELHETRHEPGFELLNLVERPLLATINFIAPPDESDRRIVAMADRCFAAAYFRKQGLA